MKHIILFTGHMIDAKDRPAPRFPAYKEASVKQEIYQKLLQQKETITLPLQGIASGACGGDILFHESCAEAGIPTEVYLALPGEEFKKASVSFAGENWNNRFNKLVEKLPVHVLATENKNNSDLNIYERTNEWMLQTALEGGGKNMTLIALWDGGGGDGKGGTEHMVKMAREMGAEVDVIDIKKL